MQFNYMARILYTLGGHMLVDSDKYPLLRNLKVDPRILGTELSAAPFSDHIAAQRCKMFADNYPQATIPRKPEFPQIYTGSEFEFGKYTFSNGTMRQDGTVLACIPKFRLNAGSNPIRRCPSYTLIYLGDDNLVHSRILPDYVQGSNGYGYDLHIDETKLIPNTPLRSGDLLCKSDAVDGLRYKLGVNANVCYMTSAMTVEDAYAMSRSLAEKLSSTGYMTLIVYINENMVPLQLYGDPDGAYKFFPDVGEKVRDDRVVCAFREVHAMSFISDMYPSALREVNSIDDYCIFAPANSVVRDISVFENPVKNIKTPAYMFEQIEKYKLESEFYDKQIIACYERECRTNGRTPAHEFSSLVTAAARRLMTIPRERVFGITKKKPSKFSRKGEQIPFIRMEIVVKYPQVASLGSKCVGRSGDKGTCSCILEDEDMPVNDYGERCDLILRPEGVTGRMNLSQLYEVFLSCCSNFVLREMKKLTLTGKDGTLEAYRVMHEFLTDVNDEYARIIDTKLFTDRNRMELVHDTIKEDMIYICVPGALASITPSWVRYMTDKYHIHATPVEYNLRDREGNLIRRVRTKKSVYIGKKYVYLLCKNPTSNSCGMGFVNQWGIPVAPKNTEEFQVKNTSPISMTPVRGGEDEIRDLIMVIGPQMTFRLLSSYANSPEASLVMANTLLTDPNPSNIMWMNFTQQMLHDTNQLTKATKALMSVIGISLEDNIATDTELELFAQ